MEVKILLLHSFISNIYIAPLQERLLRGAPNFSAAKKKSLQTREEREREGPRKEPKVKWNLYVFLALIHFTLDDLQFHKLN